MIEPTTLEAQVDALQFITSVLRAATSQDTEALLGKLLITPEDAYNYDEENPEHGWSQGRFHWIPVGRERGNAGRIKLANQPVNPIAERTINGMEALIELARQREAKATPEMRMPDNCK